MSRGGEKLLIGRRIGRGRSGKNLSKNTWRERRFLPDLTPDLGRPISGVIWVTRWVIFGDRARDRAGDRAKKLLRLWA